LWFLPNREEVVDEFAIITEMGTTEFHPHCRNAIGIGANDGVERRRRDEIASHDLVDYGFNWILDIDQAEWMCQLAGGHKPWFV
jgi:hypothetical protein